MAHPELGSKILDEVIEAITSVGKVETQARLEGRSMTMVLVPDKKPVKKKEESGEVEATEPVTPE
jgi:translation initiation factor IF-3